MNGQITQILIYSFYLYPQIDVLYTRTHLEQARESPLNNILFMKEQMEM